ncbi:MAG: Ig-like domain-containing protein [Pseudomonadota bacterium]|nr:Ig-like domain-containing protein [Pseudomonadota bacterium]
MANTRSWSVIAAAFAALVLSACGGGQLGGTTGGALGGTTGGDPGDPVPAKLILLTSSPQLSSDASGVAAGVTLTAILRDQNNNVIPGVVVVFSTQDSAEINVTNPATTDATGRATATLTTGGDPETRAITVTATGGGLTSTVVVQVVGTTLSISGLDSTQIGVPTEYTILLTDASGRGISGESIQVTTEPQNTISTSTLVTDDAGQITVELTATVQNSSITATALGLTVTQPVTVSTDQFSINVRREGQSAFLPIGPSQVPELIIGDDYEIVADWVRSGNVVPNGTIVSFAATRGSVAPASGPTSAGRAVATIESTQSGFSTLTASGVLAGQGVNSNAKVEFIAVNPAKIEVQANPASVPPNQSSEITAIVRDINNNLVKNVTVEFSLSDQTAGVLSTPTAVTNSQGLARITYSSTSQASATEGITIVGRVRGRNIQDDAQITVGGRAADITIGTGSEIRVKDESTYELPFTVVVTDSAGNPVPDAEFRLTLFTVAYAKGTLIGIDDNGDGTPEIPAGLIWCANEDLNRNDILDDDLFEDINGNGALDPGRVAALPATIPLDPDGSGQFAVTYAKSFGRFAAVEITGVATVSGTETTEKRSFVLQIAEDDVDNLPTFSPFGIDASCETTF